MAAITVITDRKLVPDFARPLLPKIEAFGFHWAYIPQYPLASLDLRVQVRDLEALAPETEVQRYAMGLSRGDQFPPVVITGDDYLLDGASRTAAARAMGFSSFPALKLAEKYEGAPEPVRKQFITLGASLNNTNGKPMNKQNMDRVIEAVLTPGKTQEQIAAELHVPVHQVRRVAARKRGHDRLVKLGVTPGDGLGISHMTVLGSKQIKHTDRVVKALAELARDAHMSGDDLRVLAGQAEAVGTEEEKLALIASERESRREQIRSANPRAAVTRAVVLRRAMGYILAHASEPEGYCELNADLVDRHVDDIFRTIKILQTVLERQQELGNARRGGTK